VTASDPPRARATRVERAGALRDDPRATRGRRAEQVVADYLVARGFSILATNLRVGRLEIDLVAQRGDLAVMVEVRTRGRTAFEGALASIAGKKRARIIAAAERLWSERLAAAPGIDRMRIDVAAVSFDGGIASVEYIEGAITA